MSMIRCDSCPDLIDSDEDPACFIENAGLPGNLGDRVACQNCREHEERVRQAQKDAADRAIAEMEIAR